MRFALELGDLSKVHVAHADFDEELDDLGSLVGVVCAAMADAGAATFNAGGFGDDAWPVDVRTDLATIVPQLPGFHAALQRGDAADLDFFGQGVERIVSFAPRNTAYLVTCRSRIGWQPRPASTIVTRAALLGMVRDLARTFADAVHQVAPALSGHPFLAALQAVVDGREAR